MKKKISFLLLMMISCFAFSEWYVSISHNLLKPSKEYENKIYEKLMIKKTYPEKARKRGIEGNVNISLVMNTDGSLYQCKINKTSNSKILDQAAISLVESVFPIEDIQTETLCQYFFTIEYKLKK